MMVVANISRQMIFPIVIITAIIINININNCCYDSYSKNHQQKFFFNVVTAFSSSASNIIFVPSSPTITCTLLPKSWYGPQYHHHHSQQQQISVCKESTMFVQEQKTQQQQKLFSLSTKPFVRSMTLSSSLSSSSSTEEVDNEGKEIDSVTISTSNTGTTFKVPLTVDEMIRQASTCMKQASNAGINRQIVRILLPRDSSAGNFGTYLEGSSTSSSTSSSSNSFNTASLSADSMIQLVPPDESWQGGIMQLYRAIVPIAVEIVRTIASDRTVNNLIPRINEDRTVDESGVDGVGMLKTDDNSISCWIQPTQENVNEFVMTANQAKSNQLVVLLNPQWRQVNDALDTASMQQKEKQQSEPQSNGFLRGLANLLGGKGAVLEACQQAGFIPVYTLEQYVCRGANVRLLQMYENKNKNNMITNTTTSNKVVVVPVYNKWNVYCERDDLESYIYVGTVERNRPTYQQVEEMLTNANIGYKYARDIGLQPKL